MLKLEASNFSEAEEAYSLASITKLLGGQLGVDYSQR